MTTLSPPKGYRPYMPIGVKLDAALRLLGIEPRLVEWDHDPALQLRIWCPVSQDTIPPANDARFIVPRIKRDHDLKTTGRRGESDLSISYNGDVSRIAKARRLTEDHESFRKSLLAKEPGQPRETQSRWPKRKFQNRKRSGT